MTADLIAETEAALDRFKKALTERMRRGYHGSVHLEATIFDGFPSEFDLRTSERTRPPKK